MENGNLWAFEMEHSIAVFPWVRAFREVFLFTLYSVGYKRLLPPFACDQGGKWSPLTSQRMLHINALHISGHFFSLSTTSFFYFFLFQCLKLPVAVLYSLELLSMK